MTKRPAEKAGRFFVVTETQGALFEKASLEPRKALPKTVVFGRYSKLHLAVGKMKAVFDLQCYRIGGEVGVVDFEIAGKGEVFPIVGVEAVEG